jgi:quercetin dioxygenase-like cupin family protein
MSPVQHPVSGSALSFSLAEESRRVRAELGDSRERIARTLVKEGSLRVTLVALRAGGALEPHKAEGPISVHVLEGDVELTADGRTWSLEPGGLLALDAGVTHDVRSSRGALFLLTVAMPVGRSRQG